MENLIACLMVMISASSVGQVKAAPPAAQQKLEMEQETCIIPISVFIPSFKKAVENEAPAESKIRAAALQVLADPKFQKGIFTLTPNKKRVVANEFPKRWNIEPASGDVVIDGITWKWEITADLPQVSTFVGRKYREFHFRPRFILGTDDKVLGMKKIEVDSDDTYDNLYYSIVGGGQNQDATKVPKNARVPRPSNDSCQIPMSLFIPSFKTAIDKETPAGSTIRKAALKALADPKLQKGTFTLTPRAGDVRFGVADIRKKRIEPASGEVGIDGFTWKWEITAYLGSGLIFADADPVFEQFKFRPRFTIRKTMLVFNEPSPWIVQVRADELRNRWFYIVAGAGKNQDATKRPKNAPRPKK